MSDVDGDGGGGGGSADGDYDPADAASKTGDACKINFGAIPPEMIKYYANTAAKSCLRCKEPIADHAFYYVQRDSGQAAVQVQQVAAAAPDAAAVATAAPSSSSIVGKLAKMTEALKIQSSFILALPPPEPDTDALIDVSRMLRSADSGHHGWTGILEMVHGELPERPLRKQLITPWTRAEHTASVVDMIRGAFSRELSRDGVGEEIDRASIFVGGKGHLEIKVVAELIHVLDVMAIGLRAVARRDAAAFAQTYTSASAKLLHSVIGTSNWFVVVRNRAIEKVHKFLASLVSAVKLALPLLPGESAKPAAASAAGAAAGAAPRAEAWLQPDEIFKRFPWVAVGTAILSRGGRDDTATTDMVWEALVAHESMVSTAVKHYTGDRTGAKASDARTAASDADGEHSDSSVAVGSKRRRTAGGGRQRRKRAASAKAAKAKADAAASAAAAAASAAAVASAATKTASPDAAKATAKARSDLIGKAVDDITKEDCLKAKLCFKCKKPRHSGSANPPCTARGQDVK